MIPHSPPALCSEAKSRELQMPRRPDRPEVSGHREIELFGMFACVGLVNRYGCAVTVETGWKQDQCPIPSDATSNWMRTHLRCVWHRLIGESHETSFAAGRTFRTMRQGKGRATACNRRWMNRTGTITRIKSVWRSEARQRLAADREVPQEERAVIVKKWWRQTLSIDKLRAYRTR